MKLDTRAMRHLASEDWRVLTAVETGSKNHEVVPTPLIEKIARLRGGSSGVHKSISVLAKAGLIARVKEAKYDGYRLTYGGLDYLALHTHSKRQHVYSVGSRIGVGKESDIMIVANNEGVQRVLKIHRLGRISFRSVKSNRDYLGNRASSSWMYLSRLSAVKEFSFMQALYEEGFPVPEPLAQSRHTIVMSLVNAYPLRQISAIPDPASLYADLIALILSFANHGLIHGDFNEFNILVKELKTKCKDGRELLKIEPVVIDFPQMVSMQHQNAEMYFDRDVQCIKRFFERRFHFTCTQAGPFFKDAIKSLEKSRFKRLDAAADASGFTKKMMKDLEAALREQATIAGEGHSSKELEDNSSLDGMDDEENQDDTDEEQVAVAQAPDRDSLVAKGLDASQARSKNSSSSLEQAIELDMSRLEIET